MLLSIWKYFIIKNGYHLKIVFFKKILNISAEDT